MPLDNPNLDRLNRALASAFSRDELRHLVSLRMDADFDHIASDKGFADQVFDLVQWAKRYGRIEELIECASTERPRNEEFKKLRYAAELAAGESANSFVSLRRIITVHGFSDYQFYVLYEDYIDVQSRFVSELDTLAESLASSVRNYDGVATVHSGEGSIPGEVLSCKEWTDTAKRELSKTPGILILNCEFRDFDPQQHIWAYLNFGEKKVRAAIPLVRYAMLLGDIAAVVANDTQEFFTAVRERLDLLVGRQVAVLVEHRNGAYGISVDIDKGLAIILNIINPEN